MLQHCCYIGYIAQLAYFFLVSVGSIQNIVLHSIKEISANDQSPFSSPRQKRPPVGERGVFNRWQTRPETDGWEWGGI